MVALIAAALTFVAIGSFAIALTQTEFRRAPIEATAYIERGGPQSRVLLRQRAASSIPLISWLLTYRNIGRQITEDLVDANWRLTAGEFVLVSAVCGVVTGAVALVVAPMPILAVIAPLPGSLVPWMMLRVARGRRRKRMHDQLVDTFMLIAGAMKAGSNLVQALESTAREIPDPMRGEIEMALDALRLGGSVEQAFADLADRVKSPDLHLVVMAIVIQRQVGGDLADVLHTTADTMRQRERIRGEISALTAQGRLSGYILGLMPLAVLAVVSFLNPEYLEPLFTTLAGRITLGVAAGFEMLGFFVIRRIVAIEV